MLVTIIEWLIIIGLFVALFFNAWDDIDRGKRIRNIQESKEFNDALVSIRKINQFFEDALKRRIGSKMILYTLLPDDPHYELMPATKEYDHNLYFLIRLRLENDYTFKMLKSGEYSGEVEHHLEELVLKDTFGKEKTEINELGIDWCEMIENMILDKNKEEWIILCYPFQCPCGLAGEERKIFTKQLKDLKII